LVSDVHARKNSSINVLVVDDEAQNADAIKRAFRKNPELVVYSSDSSSTALDQVRRERFDLFLVDYSMAGLNGVEFIERARLLAPHAVFIMLTGYPELKQVIDAHSRGIVDGILGKPWSLDELTLTIEQARSMLHLRAMRKPSSPPKS
jgi:DNA-binding NtrC family response regulator